MLINTVLRNHYKIVGLLGSGGFGDTYLAEDLDLPNKPKCVVKHLKPKTSDATVLPIARRLFEKEAEVLYRLGNLSKQIPKLFAHFEENGEFYLVQEFVDGQNLSTEIIPDQPWDEAQVVQLLQEILEVLVVVHEQNIIHRDIKPQNLMRRRDDGKIMLIDFGAVKEIKGLAQNTQGLVTSTIIIGSNGYMPNEQASSKPRLSSDIFAVGILAIQALTGRIPQEFPEDANGEIIWRHWTNVSDRLADILIKMVRYNFSQRYQSAAEALQALASLTSQTTVLASTYSVSPRKPESTNRRIFGFNRILAGTVIGVGVVTMLALSYFPKQQSPQKTEKIEKTQKTEQFISLPCSSELTSLPSTRKPDIKFSDGTEYYGARDKNNKLFGKGVMIFKNGSRYDGEFKNNQRNGCGIFSYSPNTSFYKDYVGQFVNDKFEGLGKIRWKDGREYRGNFKAGHCDGQGIFQFANGSFKSGIWQKGELRGSNLSCNI
ncbi:protein kinase domain-containing protein [Nostoc sp. ChiSLP03a]|uniref:protein kinase domain-containing protein n=1 Tax=Nostoc sp. ChiSLP03a TaxID=3075380 RepID=UPI002AD3865B|nr:protein kinase [Nostoc sp. ChiSLP03a]MDZ8211515.1 protein kinase [Nostoc sp. ChiSLP03a]